MKNSTLPLYGLGQEVNIIRKIEKVDGFGTRIKKVEIEFFTDEDLIDDEEDDD